MNIVSNFTNLKNDFIGIVVDPQGILHFFFSLILSITIFFVFYLIGNKIRTLFFKTASKFFIFVNIALGYVFVGTGIAILGFFSVLKAEIIWLYFLVILLICLYPFQDSFKVISNSLKNITFKLRQIQYDWITVGISLFILIAFLRLMTPEITEDGYHTDLPLMYLKNFTSMIETREMLHVIPYPQLPEMIYLIPIFLGEKEAARFIHFGFYILIILLLYKISHEKEYSFTKYVPLLFVTAPGVIKYSSTQYTDFFAIFLILLSISIIKRKMTTSTVVLAGILIGAMGAAKIWMLVFAPVLLVYIIILNKENWLKFSGIFIISSLLTYLIWAARAFIITGNPFFPILNTLFYKEQPLFVNPIFMGTTGQYLGFNTEMFQFQNLVILSPLFFVGIIFSVLKYRKVIEQVVKSPLFILFILFTIVQLFTKNPWGRYLLTWSIATSMIISTGIGLVINKSSIAKYFLMSVTGVIFMYYFISTLIALPYGFGWADKNKYLTRIVSRDNVSYYDFDRQFGKWINEEDLVATYGIGSYYYADFNYIDVGYILNNENKSFDVLRKNNVTKLLIKGGDIEWFCKTLEIKKCDKRKVTLLAHFPPDLDKYNLYQLK